MPDIGRDGHTEIAASLAGGILAADSEAEATAVARRLLALPDAPGVIDILMNHRDPVVRAWVADRAAELPIVDDARLALRKLARDRDSDVRDMAIGHLMSVGDDRDQQLVLRNLTANLASDGGNARFGLWMLVKLRAHAALPAIAAFRADRRNPWKELAGSVAAAVIEGRDAEVIAAIRNHDHERMQFLSIAASLIGSAEAIEALRECEDRGPDDECRRDCARALRLVRAADSLE